MYHIFQILPMALAFDSLAQIVNTLECLLFMSNPPSFINISTSHGEIKGPNDKLYYSSPLFFKLNSSLNNGILEIALCANVGYLSYLNCTKEIIECASFNYDNIGIVTSSFQMGMRKIIDLDRHYINEVTTVELFESTELFQDSSELIDYPLDEIRNTIAIAQLN
jgi:hypothetical protein